MKRTEGMEMYMKAKKRIKVLLAAFFVVGCLFVSYTYVSAKTVNYTVTYKNKTVTLFTAKGKTTVGQNASCKLSHSSYKKVSKKWGKPQKLKKKEGSIYATYKSSGTLIKLVFTKEQIGPWMSKDIKVTKKGTKVCGVGAGDTKKQALNYLRNKFGKKAVEEQDGNILLWIGGFTPTTYTIKNNKVNKITFWTS